MKHDENLRSRKLGGAIAHPLRSTRRWRWRRQRKRRDESLAGYHTPAQVCPRGCGFRELARREWLTRSSILGTALVQVTFSFETTNCPDCGALLSRECPRCHADVLAPVRDRCETCGLPQPWARERRAGIDRTRVRYWRPDDKRAHSPAVPAYRVTGRGAIWVIEGEVAQLAVDAVISNDTVDGQMWAQVARSIKTAAGEGVERLAQEESPFALGEAWSTSAGGLREMRRIIHVASMTRTGRTSPQSVESSLASALVRAHDMAEDLDTEQDVLSVGVATIGMATIRADKWFDIFARVVLDDLHGQAGEERKHELSIVLALFEPPDLKCELKWLEEAIRRSWRRLGQPDAQFESLSPDRLA
jgi:O-acetyl-ADP-ribose deacetylase (regulator of RNase III)